MPDPWKSAPLPDGEVFHLVQAAGKPEQLTQLSPNKRRAIESLCAHPRSKRMLNVLRQVLRYRGLRRGLRLGNIYRLLRMKCPHEHTYYLKHILRVWSYVMGPNRAARLDFRSVQLLEGRSPTLSTEDYDFICRQFKLGSLFPSISDTAQRRAIVCRLLHVPAMIPSVHTFMEDTKYLLPCALAMRRLTSDGPQDTIRTSLWHHFRPGHRRATDRSAFLEGYRALWLFAMQNFPDLTGALPLLDGRGRKRQLQLSGKSTEHCWRQFGSLARSLGFASPEIQRLAGPGASPDAAPRALHPRLTQYTTTDWKLRARCGMPSESSFLASRPFLTLNHIDRSLSTGAKGSLTAFAVARNIFQAFLGYLPPLGNRSSAVYEAVLPSPRERLSNASASSHSGQTHVPQTCSSSDSPRSLRTDTRYDDGDSTVVEDGAAPVPTPVPGHRRLVPSTSPRQMSYTPSVYSIGDQRSSPDQVQGICLQSDLAPLQRLNPFRETRLPLGAADLEPSPATPPSHLGLRGQPTLHHPQDFHPIAAQPDGRAILYEVGCPAVIYRLPLARVGGLFNIYFRSHPNFWYAIWADNQLRALQPAAVPEILRVNVVISGSRECWIRAQRGQFTRPQSPSRSPTWLDEIGYSQYFGRQDDS